MRQIIETGSAVLGIEFGSTRIKSVLIGPDYTPIASGSYEWENDFVDGIWTYSEEAILKGFQASYSDLKRNVEAACGVKIQIQWREWIWIRVSFSFNLFKRFRNILTYGNTT